MNWSQISKSISKSTQMLSKYATNGGIFKDTRRAMLGGNRKGWTKGLPRSVRFASVMSMALPATAQRTGKLGIKSIGWVLGHAAKHPKAATAIGISSMGIGGALRGSYRAAVNAEPRRIYNDQQPPSVGPGYNTWAKQRGMSASNLGATGSLTLALRGTRHRG